jgi:hypothetical protein
MVCPTLQRWFFDPAAGKPTENLSPLQVSHLDACLLDLLPVGMVESGFNLAGRDHCDGGGIVFLTQIHSDDCHTLSGSRL